MTRLRVSDNGRFLVHLDGSPFFPLADTAWEIAWRLDRGEVAEYIRRRAEQKFNTIAIVAFPGEVAGGQPNRYGKHPFALNGKYYDPLRPLTTPGARPDHPEEYDYWDHLQYVIDTAKSAGMYVILLPAWGNCVAGRYGSGAPDDAVIFDADRARRYGEWIGRRFRDEPNLVWMLGGDRSAVYGSRDYRPVFRAMARGILAGVRGERPGPDAPPVLISYHPQKWAPNSSAWFHDDPWLAFNSIQDQPEDQLPAIEHDYALRPAKPTWLFEGGYEHRRNDQYRAWQVRFQSYLTVFAGGFGVTYGNMFIYFFPRSNKDMRREVEENISAGRGEGWKNALNDPGGRQMQYLLALMDRLTPAQFLDRIPDQRLIAGDPGRVFDGEGIRSDRLEATRGKRGDYALIYSANGRPVPVRMSRLAGPAMTAYWYDPRTGKWARNGREFPEPAAVENRVPSGPGAPDHEFDPPGTPGDGNDWVLVLRSEPFPARP